MDLPERNANSDDPVVYPAKREPCSVNGSFSYAAWCRWRLTDPELPGDLRDILTLEAVEAEQLGALLEALDSAQGATLKEKVSDPLQRDQIRALCLRWLRAQSALLDATTDALDQKAGSNGH